MSTGPDRATAGEQRSPWTVALLGVFTLGIYAAYWLWTTAQEADRFDEQGASPFAVARWSIPTAVLGTVGAIATLIYVIQSAKGASRASSGAGQKALAEAMLSASIPYILSGVATFVGVVASVVALWRLWRFVERHERALGADTLSPGLLLGALIVSYLLFFPLPLAVGYVLHRTQRGLNRVWRASEEGYEASPRQPAGGFQSSAGGGASDVDRPEGG